MKQKITELLKAAMKEKNALSVSVYRSLKADIETAEKNGDADVLSIVAKAKKKRLDAAGQFQECGRGDLMEAELLEVDIIDQLLPKQPTNDEIDACIRECAGNISANMGAIIKYVKENYPTVDGKKLAGMVKEFLSK
ncbi:MAG: GatB/YqeY domain-containing protein [Turicibacter sp.]